MSLHLNLNTDIDIHVGDFVKIVDNLDNVLEFAYAASNPYVKEGLPVIDVTSQSTLQTFTIAVTNAIQKI